MGFQRAHTLIHGGIVERKTTIPVLSNFLFEAANDRLTVTATDLDLSLRTSCARLEFWS
jgi:DNA polymerase III sliding clamp (beta) subunit (PCNA family)